MNSLQPDIVQSHPQQDLKDSTVAGTTVPEDRLCPGCRKPAVNEQGGLVVAFGQSFFHVDCFKCAKCGNKVTADTNLLLLSDGSPICTNCTYSCNVCRLPILDEAIMTGDDSYHAHCFKCKVCKSRIDDLVFAKTSQGIYCMNCHNERMAKIRSHAQKKAERERERKAGGSASSTKSRARVAHQAGTNGASDHSASPQIPQTLNAMSPRSTDVLPSTRSVAKPISSYVSDAFEPSSSISVTIAPPAESGHVPLPPYPYKPNVSLESERGNPLKQSTLPAVPSFSANVREERRRSYDDGVRPLNILFNKDESSHQTANTPATLSAVTDTLIAPTSRQDKRRSINPGKSLFERNAHPSTQTSQLSLSPLSHTFPSNPSADRAPTPPIPNGRETHLTTLSPLRDQFPPRSPSLSRPTSHVSLQRSNSSRNSSSSSGLPYFDEQDRSQPSSPTRSDHSEDQTIVITAPSSTVAVGSVPPAKTRTKVQQSVNVGDDGSRLSTETKELETIGPSADGIRRSESRPNSSASLGAYSVSRSRSVSPAHRADVPHGIESETDTDPEDGFEEQQTSKSSVVPTLLTNDLEESLGSADGVVIEEADPTTPLLESGSEDLSESSPVEHTSHSTFIAPALPPIRLSLSSNDFSEIFSSVGGFPSRMSLSHLAKIPEAEKAGLPTVTDYDANITPTIRPPFLPSMVEESEAEDDTIKPEGMFSLSTVLPVINGQVSFENPDYPPIPPTKPLKFNGGFRRSSTPEGSQSLLTTGNNAVTSSVSHATSNHSDSMLTRITLTEPDSKGSTTISEDGREDLVTARLQEAVADARERGVPLKIDRAFVEAILSTLQMQRAEYVQLKSKFDGIKRTSRQYIEGLTVAQAEYDRELEARRDAEAEVTRLRVLLSGQVAKLTALSGDNRKEKLREQLSKELHENLSGLELDLSNLKVERDMALAEVEELEATKSGSTDLPPANLGRSLTKRLESIKHQYRRDLVPLTKEKESLQREIAELKAVRDVFLEETTVLNARNEELAQLSAAYSRRIETVPEAPPNDYHDHGRALSMDHQRAQPSYHPPPVSMSHSFSSSTSSTLHEETMDLRPPKVQKQDSDHTPSKSKFMKWGSRSKEPIAQPIVPEKKIAPLQHNFQQLSVLRFTRCDHCGDKMWGSQLRCTVCPISIHVRCIAQLQTPCIQHQHSHVQPEFPPAPLPPSMFGRDLVEQVRADARGEDLRVPVIVDKCIQAVETIALEYEGIYRKSGGAGQSKVITQLFERGDYASFDLCDSDRFNDICSVTSVLKKYFRSLPAPLLTYDLHDEFMATVQLKGQTSRDATMLDLVNRLPNEHYYTLRMLMLHLYRIHELSDINKMNARNLGVVFGPTLMRSPDPAQEFNDMAGKALTIEWLVENAPRIFNAQGGHGSTSYHQ